MRGSSSVPVGVMLLFGACSFDWDAFDPRLGGAGGETVAGQGGTSSTQATGSGGAATGGGLDCPTGTADCDGNRATGCEASLSSDAHCGACNVACVDSACTTTLSESFAAPPAKWQFNGVAHHDPASGTAVLTDASFTTAGNTFYMKAIATDSFTASFEARISDSPMGTGGGGGSVTDGPGDGLAFGLQITGATALGVSGGGLALAGLEGFGFELDTYSNGGCGDPVFEHASVIDLAVCMGADMDLNPTTLQASAMLPVPLPETGWHLVEVNFQNGVASMRLDSADVVGATTIPAFVPGTPYFYGFGAGTGGAVNRHEVRNFTVTFPTPRCI